MACAAFRRGGRAGEAAVPWASWEGAVDGVRGFAGKAKSGGQATKGGGGGGPKGKGSSKGGDGRGGRSGKAAGTAGKNASKMVREPGFTGEGSVRPGVYTGTATSKGLSGVDVRELKAAEAKQKAEQKTINIERARMIIEMFDKAQGKGKDKAKGIGKGKQGDSSGKAEAKAVPGDGKGKIQDAKGGQAALPAADAGRVKGGGAMKAGTGAGPREGGASAKEGGPRSGKERVKVVQQPQVKEVAALNVEEVKEGMLANTGEKGKKGKKGRKDSGASAMSTKAIEAMRKAEEAAEVQRKLEAKWGGRLPTYYSFNYPRDPTGVNPYSDFWDVRMPSRHKMTHTRYNAHVYHVKKRNSKQAAVPMVQNRAMTRAFRMIKDKQRGEGVYREIREKQFHMNGAVKRRRRTLHEDYFAKKRAIKVNIKHVMDKIKWDAEMDSPLKTAY